MISLVFNVALALQVTYEKGEYHLKATREECQTFNQDVAYVPDVAADGTPLVPATLPSFELPTLFTIPLKFDLSSYGLNQVGEAGVVSLDLKNNQVYFNGKPMGDEMDTALKRACATLSNVK